MAVFSVQPQAGTVELDLAYLTEVARSDNGTEQRASYREIPARRLRFAARAMDPRSAARLEALTYGAHGAELTVPYWPHASELSAPAAPGSNVVLSLDTADRDFQVGGWLVLWLDEDTVEACAVLAVGGGSVTVSSLAGTWPAGAKVLPAWTGTFAGSVESDKLGALAAEARLEFLLRTDPDDPNVAEATEAAVFDVVPVSRVDATHTQEALIDRQESPFYEHTDYRRRAYPVGGRPYVLWLAGKAAVRAMVEWFHGVRGRLRPFWIPTFQQDFDVLGGLGTGTVTVAECGYAARLFAARERRQLAFFSPDGTIAHIEVSNAVDNGDGTESLFLAGSSPADAVQVSYMLFARLESDALTLSWDNSETAQCAIGVIELPGEIVPPGITPGLGSATFEGFAPSVLTAISGAVAAPGAAAAMFTGFAPSVGTLAPAPGTASAEFVGYAPTLFMGTAVAPAPGLAVFTGHAPSLAVQPGTAVARFTGYKPRVKVH